MKSTKYLAFTAMLSMLILLSACSGAPLGGETSASPSQSQGQIYLYGEQHAEKNIQDKEFELWQDYYDNQNMRHLFIELPYYTAELLNIWMKSDNDDILNGIFKDLLGTPNFGPSYKEFYKKIKAECPETIFHGTDIGHGYETNGNRYLKYLKDNDLEESQQYLLAQEAIGQGRHFDESFDEVYRENKMVENFIREFDKLSGENVMGIYGAAHTGLDALDFTNTNPCMANQLKEHYGDAVHSEDLSYLADDPIRMDTININGKEYEASYFGKEKVTWSDKFAYREVWRLENAYDDFKDKSKTGDMLPDNNYPIQIETGQVFVIDYIKADGSVERQYYRSDGFAWKGKNYTEEFTP